MSTNSKICFVIMGYGKRTDYKSGKKYDLNKTYLNIIKPAVEKAGYMCIRGDEVQESSIIDKNMFGLLIYADLVIADITTLNPNVIYELGIRHAAKPYSTIIMKENECEFPFDFSHSKIFTYSHLGEDIGATEADRCKTALTSLISTLDKSKETDSPLFSCLSISPYKLTKENYTALINELSEKENLIFAVVEKANSEMLSNNFKEAAKLWKKVCEKVGTDPYYIQQYALCTYKSSYPTKQTALTDALEIIKRLEPEGRTTNDPETLGIAGAINKRLWLLTNDIEFLNRAIAYYGKGFNLNSDYYTGNNYALCLELKSEQVIDNEEKISYKFNAKETRKQIIKIIELLKVDDEFEKRSDIRWIYSTLALCYLSQNNEELYSKYEHKFEALKQGDWEWETYCDSKRKIINLKK